MSDRLYQLSQTVIPEGFGRNSGKTFDELPFPVLKDILNQKWTPEALTKAIEEYFELPTIKKAMKQEGYRE
jgi:hypothetical protein